MTVPGNQCYPVPASITCFAQVTGLPGEDMAYYVNPEKSFLIIIFPVFPVTEQVRETNRA
jgi:hypothetical protein